MTMVNDPPKTLFVLLERSFRLVENPGFCWDSPLKKPVQRDSPSREGSNPNPGSTLIMI